MARMKGYAHRVIDGELVTVAPGDPVPEWVTNEELIDTDDSIVEDADTGTSGETAAGDELDALKKPELQAIAKELGVAASGNVAEIRDRIRAKRAEDAGDDSDSDGGSERESLEAQARELGIEFDADVTDEDLAAAVSASTN